MNAFSRTLVSYVSILCVATVQSCSLARPVASASSIQPVQLRGLSMISLQAYVDPDIAEHAEIERQIDALAEKLLREAGLQLSSGPLVSVEVRLYPLDKAVRSDHILLRVRTELVEEVILARDACHRLFNGAITWETSWVMLKSKSDAASAILDQVSLQLDSFCADLQAAAR